LRRLLITALSVAVGLGLFTAAPSALAQGKAEGPAKALQKKAMEEDYLSTDFAKAQEKLEKAVGLCGTDKCSPQFRARLKRDLGVVQIGGGIDKEKGIASFVEAIKLDPAIALDPDIKTKDLEQAFAEAKKRAAAGGGAAAAPVASGAQPAGDFTHTPAAEQQVRTPIPVYVEYSGEEPLVRVIARYKGFGMTEWKTVELKKMTDKGWGGLLPCADVQQGTTQYYIQGFNANNDPIATSGDRNNPFRVAVKTEKVDEPPHLPNAPPPTQCADTGDCPPNFPGCKKAPVGATPAVSSNPEPVGKDGGEFCEEDSECKSNKCQEARCTDYETKKGRRLWIGVAGALDYVFVPSSNDVCKLSGAATPLNSDNYYCVRDGGTDYPSRDPAKGAENTAIRASSAPGGSDKVSGGGALGNVRLMLTVDYAVTSNVLIGGRLGLVLNTYPGSEAQKDGKFAVPVHAEVRATYVFGKDALFTKGLSPYVFGGLGVGQFTAPVSVQVVEDVAGQAPSKRQVDAWNLSGPFFLAAGGGGRYAITPRFAFLFGARLNLPFPLVPSVGPELGGQMAF
jgi:hypothetical protein